MGLEHDRLAEMLAGRASIDVDAAIRLSRALQISADAIMRMQLRADFAVARSLPGYDGIVVLRAPSPIPFPDHGFLTGRLGQSADVTGDQSFFFQEDVLPEQRSEDYAGFHALFRGDRLRVYDRDGRVLWTGPVLHGLEGRLHLPYVRASEWPDWFAQKLRAELAIGDEHAAFFVRMGRV